jgi:hypothetical protein
VICDEPADGQCHNAGENRDQCHRGLPLYEVHEDHERRRFELLAGLRAYKHGVEQLLLEDFAEDDGLSGTFEIAKIMINVI